MEKIVVVLPLEERHRAQLLAAAGDRAELIFYTDTHAIEAEQVAQATALIGLLSPRRLQQATGKLRWLQLPYAGVDAYIAPGILPAGVTLTNATGAYGPALSEHMLGSLLMLMKKLHLYLPNQQAHLWRDEGPVRSVSGSRTLIYGCGDVGCTFARKLHALGGRVWGVRRHPGETPEGLEAMVTPAEAEALLPEMDVVVCALPATQETRHFFDAAFFAGMRSGAYFLNIGRGVSVDSLALCDALHSGHLAGAAVDVTDPEPLPADHPLWDAPNLVLTPHIAGVFHLPQTLDYVVDIAAENIRRFTAGLPLRNVVDPTTGLPLRG